MEDKDKMPVTLMELIQKAVDDDVNEYLELKGKADSDPTTQNLKNFEDKRKQMIKDLGEEAVKSFDLIYASCFKSAE